MDEQDSQDFEISNLKSFILPILSIRVNSLPANLNTAS